MNQTKPPPQTSQFTCNSQKLMLYNGIIHQEQTGVYHLLPLGQRVMEKLTKVIDDAMGCIGAQKMTMPCLTSASLWKQSDRWQDMCTELFSVKDRHGMEICLAPTHEESVTALVSSQCPLSYRNLPMYLYQINTKFRDEILPKYGLLRAREFIMKDMYSFDMDAQATETTYNKVIEAYRSILNKLQLPYVQVEADPGNIGGTLSHEFHIPCTVGEDTILVCHRCGKGYNMEIIDAKLGKKSVCETAGCGTDLVTTHGIEVAHTFHLGTKYSSVFDCTFKDQHGHIKYMEMGCYGIGVSRLLQASVEVLSTDKFIRWPTLIAPYTVCIIPQKEGYKAKEFMDEAIQLAENLESYPQLNSNVVLDDRTDLSVGRRIYEAKKRGFPSLIIVNKMVLNPTEPKFEFIDAYQDTTFNLSATEIIDLLTNSTLNDIEKNNHFEEMSYQKDLANSS